MQLLTDEEIDALWLPDGITKPQMIVRRAVVRAAEKALLAKLGAMDLPEAIGAYKGEVFYLDAPTEYEKSQGWEPLFSTEQFNQAYAQGFAQGAAAQLADKPSAWAMRDALDELLTNRCSGITAGVKTDWRKVPLYTRREAK